ncbi:MAG: hypothetical protein GY771_13240 [bacterium]|nr:hypothetical protein [bacterium]
MGKEVFSFTVTEEDGEFNVNFKGDIPEDFKAMFSGCCEWWQESAETEETG